MARTFKIPTMIVGQHYRAETLNRVAQFADHGLRYMFAHLFSTMDVVTGARQANTPYCVGDSFLVEPVDGTMSVRVLPGVAFDDGNVSYGLDPNGVPGIENQLVVSPIELEQATVFSVAAVSAGGDRQRKDLICIRSHAAAADQESLIVVRQVGVLPSGRPEIEVQPGIFATAVDRALDNRAQSIQAGDLPGEPFVYIQGVEAQGWDPTIIEPWNGNVATAPAVPAGYTPIAVITVNSDTTEIERLNIADQRRIAGVNGYAEAWMTVRVNHDDSLPNTQAGATWSVLKKDMDITAFETLAIGGTPSVRIGMQPHTDVTYPNVLVHATGGKIQGVSWSAIAHPLRVRTATDNVYEAPFGGFGRVSLSQGPGEPLVNVAGPPTFYGTSNAEGYPVFRLLGPTVLGRGQGDSINDVLPWLTSSQAQGAADGGDPLTYQGAQHIGTGLDGRMVSARVLSSTADSPLDPRFELDNNENGTVNSGGNIRYQPFRFVEYAYSIGLKLHY